MDFVDWLVDVGNWLWSWYDDEKNQNKSNAIAAAVGGIAVVLAPIIAVIWWFVRKLSGKPGNNDDDGGSAPAPNGPVSPPAMVTMTLEDFQQKLEERAQEARAELAASTGTDADIARAELGELEQQLANITASYEAAQTRIAELEQLLIREGNDIGADRLQTAREKLERGDYSDADAIFAEIKARDALAVQRSARASFGRGEIAEAEVRWLDAAEHYAEAARLDPTYETLVKAGKYLWRAGRHGEAIGFGERLVAFCREEFGGEDARIAAALNNLAEGYRAVADYNKAEPLYREAMEVTRLALGDAHPDYAIGLNNLAGLLRDTGRAEKAEPLYREALEVTRRALGEAHPDCAIRLNNLAGLLRDTGRYDKAEPLYREALEIGRKALGEAHPDYAIGLNNLALLLEATGRHTEAESLYREALEIGREPLGEAHPDYAIRLNNLAELLRVTGRYDEAEPLYREAVAVIEAALGADHPNSHTARANLEAFLAERDP